MSIEKTCQVDDIFSQPLFFVNVDEGKCAGHLAGDKLFSIEL